ncbi:CYTH domain-containing protein [Rhizobium straminoryzae]|uniref:CYTH domain-containing protein n=1 Tax=Rhizobium straminoryzae TaxID=1387186 RepID=A0A549TAX3_9HYPH|nr:CYTH domain-containing protein [Rhizobium straminoryzae]TRL39024.1 CYTH domain-containing protein [Rhizobium straminoryzae]
MAKEIERKFLVRSEDWRRMATSRLRFRQGYVAIGEDRSVRVRLMEGPGVAKARLTIKVGRHLLARDEYEYEISVGDAEELIVSAIGIVIEKTRHFIPHAGFTWEVDEFSGAYKGLILAEVELESPDQSPPLPVWIGREVTGDRRFSNMVMATETISVEQMHGLSHQTV